MTRVHFIGICGVGMSATALLMKEAGYEVTGSDAECYGSTAEILKRAAIPARIGYDAAQLPEADEYVTGRNAKLNPKENAEVAKAFESGKPIHSFAQIVGRLTTGRDTLVVAGSYGKSSTTALLAHIISATYADVGYLIGAEPLSLPAPSSLGAGLFIVEGDEYPSAHDDPRAKFMHLHPTDVLLTAVVHDHVNVYPTMEEYERPFRTLLSLMPENGIVVACADERNALRLAEESGHQMVTYGVREGTYRATDVTYGEHTTFTLVHEGDAVIELSTTLLGAHNIENIVGASAYALARGLATPDALRDAVASFTGIRRRLDRVAPKSRVPVYEGFGSSYEKARAAIAALKLHFPEQPLTILFEPHTFGWRNRANANWYKDVFAGAEAVFVAAPATQGAATHDQLSYEEIMALVNDAGIAAHPYDAHNPAATVARINPESIVLILSSGDMEGSMTALLAAFEHQFPI